MRLFIAEKPSLGREIAKALGGGMEKQGYIEISNGQDIVTWELGHLRARRLRRKIPATQDGGFAYYSKQVAEEDCEGQ